MTCKNHSSQFLVCAEVTFLVINFLLHICSEDERAQNKAKTRWRDICQFTLGDRMKASVPGCLSQGPGACTGGLVSTSLDRSDGRGDRKTTFN